MHIQQVQQIPTQLQQVQVHNQVQSMKIPMHPQQPPPKEDFSEFINIKFESIDDLLHSSSTNERNKTEVMEILGWAKNYHISDSAVEALLGVLKLKKVKTEVKNEQGDLSKEIQQRKFCDLFHHFSYVNINFIIHFFSIQKP